MSDIFSTLSRFGLSSRENYLSEGLVYLVKLLLERQPIQAVEFINIFCSPPELISDPKSVQISTQKSYETGRPDIQIKAADNTLILIEVKHDSALAVNQLERYFAELQASRATNTSLIFLTRSLTAAQPTKLPSTDYVHVCWYQVNDFLNQLKISDDICTHFIREFSTFLEGKKMSHKKVSWEYIEGIQAMENLVIMLESAISEVKPELRFRRTAGWHWKGFKLDGSFWCGIRFFRPSVIGFENNRGNNPTLRRELDLHQAHFFSLSSGEQFECLIDFLQKTYNESPQEAGIESGDLPIDDEEAGP